MNDRTGLTSRKGASLGTSSSSFASAASSAGKNSTGSASKPGEETYAEAAAEEPDPQESVVREDKVGVTERK